jgi:hypothetical protein
MSQVRQLLGFGDTSKGVCGLEACLIVAVILVAVEITRKVGEECKE